MASSGDRLKEVREELAMTQKEFAEVFSLKWHKIKDIEIGKHKLTPDLAEEIEQKYSISGWWLLRGKGHKYIQAETNINNIKS